MSKDFPMVFEMKQGSILKWLRYCNEAAWMAVLNLIEKKKKWKWTCSLCEKSINQNKESVACERCLHGFI